MRDVGVLMALPVPDAGCGSEWRRFSWQFADVGLGGWGGRIFSWKSLLVGGRGRGLHGRSRHRLFEGESVVLMAVPDACCVGLEA